MSPPFCVQPILKNPNVGGVGAAQPPPPLHRQQQQQQSSPKVVEEDKENDDPTNNNYNNPSLASILNNNDLTGGGGGTNPNSPQHFTFSPKILKNPHQPPPPQPPSNHQQSPQILTSAGYKLGNYFRFPDVDVFSPKRNSSGGGTPPITTAPTEREERIASVFDQLRIDDAPKSRVVVTVAAPVAVNVVPPPTLITSTSTLQMGSSIATRRARLKSISLDSESARLVEENLGIPVEEIIDNRNNIRQSATTKNKNNLTINLSKRDDSLTISAADDYKKVNAPTTPKTPTLTQTRQKAISLDSDNRVDDDDDYDGDDGEKKIPVLRVSSISVPSTPKHHRGKNMPPPGLSIANHPIIVHPSYHYTHSAKKMLKLHQAKTYNYTKKLGSFDENMMMAVHDPISAAGSPSSSSNLQVLKTTSLSQSNNNLKTLPEIMTLSDFTTNSPVRLGSTSNSEPSPSIAVSAKPRNSILQRRGSNHSLTLNLDGSMGNLTKSLSTSNYSLGSHYNLSESNPKLMGKSPSVAGGGGICNRKNLLQRRGSNTSLTLNIQNSSCSLNRFNSHSSLNISANHPAGLSGGGVGSGIGPGCRGGKGLLERRNSNASLTLNISSRGLSISNTNLRGSECSLSSINTNHNEVVDVNADDDPAPNHISTYHPPANDHHRKYFSSENLAFGGPTPSASHLNARHKMIAQTQNYGSIDDLKQQRHTSNCMVVQHHVETEVDLKTECQCMENTHIRNITTKPLSPQTTSEDFKIYLANIQFLQSATNVLNETNMRNLNHLFNKNYNNDGDAAKNDGDDNDEDDDDEVEDTRKSLEMSMRLNEDDQKRLLRSLHQEFWELPTNYQEKPMVFGSQLKNRYKTILPNEHSRVLLKIENGKLEEPYINANYIKVSLVLSF